LTFDADKLILAGNNPKHNGENLKKTFRLRKASDFVRLAKQAEVFKGRGFLIRYLDNWQGHARLGVAVSKRTVKHAVVRNRIKRIIRETFRKHCLALPSKDYMIIYKGTQNLNDASLFCRSLNRFWQHQATHLAVYT